MKGFKLLIVSTIFLLGVGILANAQNKVVWQIGEKDNSCEEFALAQNSYRRYSEVFPEGMAVFSVGSGTAKNIPFVIPGPDDAWAGHKEGSILIRFNVADAISPENIELVMDMIAIHSFAPPRLRVTLNDFSAEINLPAGDDQNFLDRKDLTQNSVPVTSKIPSSAIRQGENVLRITNIRGSWTVLDDIRLEASSDIHLKPCQGGVSLAFLKSRPALVYGDSKADLRSPIQATVVNWGKRPVKADYYCNGVKSGVMTLSPGVNTKEITVSGDLQGKKVNIGLVCGRTRTDKDVEILPADKWTVYLVQHTHTDIGYTKPQTEILTEHLRYIDYALEYCEATDNYPEDSKFRWTCEASWAVKEWLKSRPASQVEKFLHFVRKGQIEVTAMFFNMAELSGEDNYLTFLSPIKTFKEMGIPVVTAMQNDVNGVAWCLADYLSGLGVKYMTMGSNSHRADIPFDRPTLYKWESPSGNSLLSYRSDHYMTGNRWGIDRGDDAGMENGVFSYISSLKSRGYDIPLVSVQYSGYSTDNSPPSMHECELIKRWNDHYAWPKLRSATIREFLDKVDSEYSEGLPTYRAAYPDWWTDGFGSAARETAASRSTQSDMTTIEGIMAMAAVRGDDYPFRATEEIDRIHENLLFYNEHTFGASESIRNPMCENSQVQWAEKGSYVWEALKSAQMMYEAAAARMQGHLYRAEKPTLTFFNSMTHPRSELVKVYIDYELIPRDRNFTITDGNGNILKWQPLNSRSEGRYYAIYAENIPAMGYRTYELVVEDGFQPQEKYENISETAPSVENNFYKLTFDTSRGGLCSVIDKENGKELIDRNAKWNAGEVIYESLKGDRHQMERKVFKHYSREGMSDIRFSGVRKGSVYTSVFYNGRLRGCSFAGVNVEVRLFNDVKRIELSYSLERLPETDPSGIYVAFPFELQDGKLFFDVPGGTVLAGETQIPRSSAAWNTVQNFTAARNSEMQIIVSTDEIPLFLMGEMMDDPYRIDHRHKGQHLYSWVMNNYWTTNFRASQEGELRWTYSLTSSSNVANSAAAEFGRGNRTPLYARVNPPSATKSTSSNPKEKSFLRIEAANIVTVSCRPTRHGNKSVILNIIETDGKKTNLEILGQDGKPVPFRTVNALEESLDGTEPRTQLTMLPYSNIFVRIDL